MTLSGRQLDEFLKTKCVLLILVASLLQLWMAVLKTEN